MEADLEDHVEHHMEEICRMEVMGGLSRKRRWSDTFNGRIVVETLVTNMVRKIYIINLTRMCT